MNKVPGESSYGALIYSPLLLRYMRKMNKLEYNFDRYWDFEELKYIKHEVCCILTFIFLYSICIKSSIDLTDLEIIAIYWSAVK